MEKINAWCFNCLRVLTASALISSSCVYGTVACDNPVSPIHTGEVAPCDGFIFSNDAEKQAEGYRADSQFYKSYSDQLNQKIKLEEDENSVLQQRLNLYVQESRTLAQDTAKHDSNESLFRFGYFLLGVLATGLVVRNVRP